MRAFIFLAALTACGGDSALIGSRADNAGEDVVYTFKSDGSWAFDSTSTDSSTSCTTVLDASGTYTTIGSMLTMAQLAPSNQEISGCTDSTMNMAKGIHPQRRVLGDVYTWTVSGNTLTLDPGNGEKKVLTKR